MVDYNDKDIYVLNSPLCKVILELMVKRMAIYKVGRE